MLFQNSDKSIEITQIIRNSQNRTQNLRTTLMHNMLLPTSAQTLLQMLQWGTYAIDCMVILKLFLPKRHSHAAENLEFRTEE